MADQNYVKQRKAFHHKGFGKKIEQCFEFFQIEQLITFGGKKFIGCIMYVTLSFVIEFLIDFVIFKEKFVPLRIDLNREEMSTLNQNAII